MDKMYCIKCGKEIYDGSIYCNWCGKKQTQEKRKAIKRANGTGTVYKLSGRRKRPWVAAKNRVIIGYYERKIDALGALERLAGKDITERYNMTFKDVYNDWKEEHFKSIGEKGIESYERAFSIFKPLHDKKFREIKTGDFQFVIDAHMQKSNSTVSKYKQLITQMSNWAIREEITTTNFAKYVKVPENTKQEKKIFSEDDIKKLKADNSEAAKIVLMLICTGMRIGELFNLPFANYHERYVIGGEKTEAGKNRIIPILPEGRRYFKYFAEKSDGELLISGYSGQKVIRNFRQRDYYPLLERLEIERKTPHATRHTYASRARKNGMRPDILQKILGHADYATTANIYLHTDIEELLNAIENI